MKIENYNELSNILDKMLKTTNVSIPIYQNMIKTNPLINGDFSYCAIEKKDYEYIKNGLKEICIKLNELTEYARNKNENADISKIAMEFLSGERDIEELFSKAEKVIENKK